VSSSIFTISNWVTATSYGLNDIISYTDTSVTPNTIYNYYCIAPHTAGTFATDKLTKWGGRIIYSRSNVDKPHFFWKPSYEAGINLDPRVKTIKFGDGYEQRVPDGINNTLLKFELRFLGRDLSESAAILHFLKARQGTESFVFTPFQPFDRQSLFKASTINSDFVFYNNYNITTTFEEVPN
jgi:phage-related protein